MTTPTPSAPVELPAGVPTGSSGPIGQDSAGTWSLLEQEQAFTTANTPAATSSSTSTSSNTSSSTSTGGS